jgi:hypothetical protein
MSATPAPATRTVAPTPEKTLPPFKALVDLKGFGATCDEPDTNPKERCWLPTQFEPKLRAGETVTLRDKWPLHGHSVDVVCEVLQGEEYSDGKGNLHYEWYGILVPKGKAEPNPVPRTSTNRGRMPTSIDGKYLVFVPASWLVVRGTGAMNDCADLVR